MGITHHLAVALSVLLFLVYGLHCLFANGMVDEFERYGLSRFRRLTGLVEILGALGLLVGYVVPAVGAASAGGLVILMVLGLGVRVKVGDRPLEMVPAAVLLLVNAFIFVGIVGAG